MNDTTPALVPTRRLAGAPLRDDLLAQIRDFLPKLPRAPQLVIVQVGQHPASKAYIRNKQKAAESVGILCQVRQLDPAAGEPALHDLLGQLAEDEEVQAVVPQLPLPAGWDGWAAIEQVPALKDCDGLTAANRALRIAGDPAALLPATPLGVLRLLAREGVRLTAQKIAVVGRGPVVGQPLRELLAQAGAEVIGIDTNTPNPTDLARQADVICSAAGVAGLIGRDWVKPGALVVDIGLSEQEHAGHRVLKGDADADSLMGLARALTPVPGGVGPLTVASLLTNVVDGACLQWGLPRTTWTV